MITTTMLRKRADARGKPLSRGHKKKARTRQQLVAAALRIYARKGSAQLTLNELAEDAGVASGTVYNYFRTREEVLEEVSLALAEQYGHAIVARSTGLSRGVERIAVGVRMFALQALRDPEWASAVASVVSQADSARSALAEYIREDLRLGLRQGDLRYADEEIALRVLVYGTIASMVAVVEGRASPDHDCIIAEMLLLALGA